MRRGRSAQTCRLPGAVTSPGSRSRPRCGASIPPARNPRTRRSSRDSCVRRRFPRGRLRGDRPDLGDDRLDARRRADRGGVGFEAAGLGDIFSALGHQRNDLPIQPIDVVAHFDEAGATLAAVDRRRAPIGGMRRGGVFARAPGRGRASTGRREGKAGSSSRRLTKKGRSRGNRIDRHIRRSGRRRCQRPLPSKPDAPSLSSPGASR